MRINFSSNVGRDWTPEISFAFEFAKAKAKSLGKQFNPAIQVTSCTDRGRGYRGRAFLYGRSRVLLRLAKELPPHRHRYARYSDMPCFDLAGGSESVVYLAAHEFGHIIGWPGDKAGETACCKFGYSAVEAWRERQYEHPACMI